MDLYDWSEWRFSDSHDKPLILWEAFTDPEQEGLLDTLGWFEEALIEAYTNRNINMGGDLTNAQWLRLFRHAGYLSDGPERPTAALIVYRGSWWPKAPAWTSDLDVAAWFARRNSSPIWEAEIEPRHVLARFDGMHESEVVVSPFAPPLRLGQVRCAGRHDEFVEHADRHQERIHPGHPWAGTVSEVAS